MPVIKDITTGKEVKCRKEDNLLAVLLQEKIYVNNACNGKGTCGKCKVIVKRGELSPMTIEEQEKLSEEDKARGVRLACMVQVYGDCTVQTDADSKKMTVLASGYIPEFEKDVEKEGYGVAIDIGTTTIAMSLVSMKTGEIIAREASMNGQRTYGQDVLTRITYEMESEGEGIHKLQEAVVDSINQGIYSMCQETGISHEEIVDFSIAGNCTMIHMLLGVDARSIGVAPYKPAFLTAQEVKASELGILASKEAKVYCLAQVSGYIGGDILAGAYVCDLEHQKKSSLFIDIGTNGEMILAKDGKLFACSCAAGPALEGMNITCGMPALPGAIESVRVKNQEILIGCIEEEPPKGICGSGILEVVAALVEQEFVKRTGAFVKEKKLEEGDWRREFLVEEEGGTAFLLDKEHHIVVTQKDVRQVQLAKGAILSGFLSLTRQGEMKIEDLDEVIIAGQFGSHLSADALAGTGIIPMQVKDKVRYVGNTSKTGAYMALLSRKVRREMEELARKIEYFELAESEGYEQLFVESMRF